MYELGLPPGAEPNRDHERERKKVSSHIQVIKNFFKPHPYCKLPNFLLFHTAYGGSPTSSDKALCPTCTAQKNMSNQQLASSSIRSVRYDRSLPLPVTIWNTLVGAGSTPHLAEGLFALFLPRFGTGVAWGVCWVTILSLAALRSLIPASRGFLISRRSPFFV